jgi:hypothetical protein
MKMLITMGQTENILRGGAGLRVRGRSLRQRGQEFRFSQLAGQEASRECLRLHSSANLTFGRNALKSRLAESIMESHVSW